MRNKRSRDKRRSSRAQPEEGASRAGLQVTWMQALCAAGIALLAATHLASIAVEFQAANGLHRWFMTYAEGFHRRGLVGTIFQFLVGHRPREAQIELASQVSDVATWLWLAATFGLFGLAAVRVRNRSVLWVALAFAAFALINPMWTTRIHDNGYLDWLSGLAVVGSLTAFICKRPVLSGTLVAVAVIGYWGTMFVWLPLGFLITCLLMRDALALPAGESPLLESRPCCPESLPLGGGGKSSLWCCRRPRGCWPHCCMTTTRHWPNSKGSGDRRTSSGKRSRA